MCEVSSLVGENLVGRSGVSWSVVGNREQELQGQGQEPVWDNCVDQTGLNDGVWSWPGHHLLNLISTEHQHFTNILAWPGLALGFLTWN